MLPGLGKAPVPKPQVALVTALIYLAWRVGSYYDAAKKKL